jgi:glycosyltransferase involved in cell wall biosynthesis
VKLLLFELAVFEEISHDIPQHDYIFKVDSDVLFISDRIFKKVLSENYDAVGQRKPDNFMEGGSYFLKSTLVRRIVRSPIHKAIRYAKTSWKCPINESPEDRAITKLVEQNGGKLLLCDYRLHGSEFRKLLKWADIDAYSIIHFSYYAGGLRKELMIKMWELLKKKELLDAVG